MLSLEVYIYTYTHKKTPAQKTHKNNAVNPRYFRNGETIWFPFIYLEIMLERLQQPVYMSNTALQNHIQVFQEVIFPPPPLAQNFEVAL